MKKEIVLFLEERDENHSLFPFLNNEVNFVPEEGQYSFPFLNETISLIFLKNNRKLSTFFFG